MKIIGLVGFIGSGKGSVGNILAEYGYKKHSFASSVKDVCANIFGWPRILLEGDSEESRYFREKVDPYWSMELGRENFTPRVALQLTGTESGRLVFGENVWIASCMNRIQNSQEKYHVITDVRFKNEVAAIHKKHGIIIRVKRGPEPCWFPGAMLVYNQQGNLEFTRYMSNVAPDLHISEWDWIGSKIDYIIENNGTFANLKSKVDDIIKLEDLKLHHGEKYETVQ